jgi:hypothetical protein
MFYTHLDACFIHTLVRYFFGGGKRVFWGKRGGETGFFFIRTNTTPLEMQPEREKERIRIVGTVIITGGVLLLCLGLMI